MQGLTQARGGLSATALVISVVAALAIAPTFANPGGGGTGGGGNTGGTSGGDTGGTSGGTSSGNTGLDKLNCRSGFVVDPAKHICVPEQQSGIMPDEDLINAAFALTEDGRYQDALDTLDRLQNPQTAVALNYRGYATRKAGRVDEGIGYYLQSVAIDPAYPQVREYLGEAYVIQGKLDLANQQLVVIASLCGTTCESYVDLAEAIEAAE